MRRCFIALSLSMGLACASSPADPAEADLPSTDAEVVEGADVRVADLPTTRVEVVDGGDDLTAADGVADGSSDPEVTSGDVPSLEDADGGGGVEPHPCPCDEEQVWLSGTCVPTTWIGCGPACDVEGPSTCSEGLICDPEMVDSSCLGATTVGACVPQMSIDVPKGALRLDVTTASVGEEMTITVRGHRFYIGALGWVLRVHDTVVSWLDATGDSCTLSTPWTPTDMGVYPVEVAYGAGGAPNIGWAVAGFIAVDAPNQGIQPGFPCEPGEACAMSGGYTCACVEGVCACEPP